MVCENAACNVSCVEERRAPWCCDMHFSFLDASVSVVVPSLRTGSRANSDRIALVLSHALESVDD